MRINILEKSLFPKPIKETVTNKDKAYLKTKNLYQNYPI